MEMIEGILERFWGKMLVTAMVSMVPVLELRGGIPIGIALGLKPMQALAAGLLGNMFPIPFIIVYIRRIFQWLRRRLPWLERMLDALERKAHLKGANVKKYGPLGLFLLVAIPLPGTGGWTGALVAAFLNLRMKNALPAIFLGILTAGLIMIFLSNAIL